MGYIFNESVIKGGTPSYKLGYIGYKMGYIMGHTYKSRYKTVFCYKIGYICYKRGYLFFIKLGTSVIKLDTVQDMVIKIGTRVMLQKGGIYFYKIRYIGYKIGYDLGHSYKHRYACYKSRYHFYGYVRRQVRAFRYAQLEYRYHIRQLITTTGGTVLA